MGASGTVISILALAYGGGTGSGSSTSNKNRRWNGSSWTETTDGNTGRRYLWRLERSLSCS